MDVSPSEPAQEPWSLSSGEPPPGLLTAGALRGENHVGFSWDLPSGKVT